MTLESVPRTKRIDIPPKWIAQEVFVCYIFNPLLEDAGRAESGLSRGKTAISGCRISLNWRCKLLDIRVSHRDFGFELHHCHNAHVVDRSPRLRMSDHRDPDPGEQLLGQRDSWIRL